MRELRWTAVNAVILGPCFKFRVHVLLTSAVFGGITFTIDCLHYDIIRTKIAYSCSKYVFVKKAIVMNGT